MVEDDEFEYDFDDDDSDEEDERSWAYRAGIKAGQLVGIVLVFVAIAVAIGLLAGLAYAIYQAFPPASVERPSGDLLERIIGDRYVIYGLRVLLLVAAFALLLAAFYVALSIIVRTARGHWLTKVGWFEADVSKRVEQQLTEAVDPTLDVLNEAWAQNEDLERRLEAALGELQSVVQAAGQLADERDALEEELEKLRAGQPPEG